MDNFSSHESDAHDIGIAVFLAETKSFAQVRADNVAVENGDLTSALKEQRGENFTRGALA